MVAKGKGQSPGGGLGGLGGGTRERGAGRVQGSGAHEVRAHEESGGRARRALERRAARLALTPVGRLEAIALQTDHHSFGIASAEEVRDEGLRSCLAHNHF